MYSCVVVFSIIDMPTVAPGWPNVHSSHQVCTESTLISVDQAPNCSDAQQLGDKTVAATKIGIINFSACTNFV